jgi:hypothetical protein
VVNDTTITATVPAGAAGTASVVVTTPVGSSAANSLYTYTTPTAVPALSLWWMIGLAVLLLLLGSLRLRNAGIARS